YIAETLETIIDGHPHSRIEDLMPWRFRQNVKPASIGLRLSAYLKQLLACIFLEADEVLHEISD
ncbi:hypothetical protein, partial [Bradyrhizobium sp. SSUT77]|uniref:hypothetical protein n=1 Tax=Bradyrhizobium sp. SSUT77 TaxID=3040603 RepID=UPI00244A90D0